MTCKWCQRPKGCCDCQDRIDCPKRGQLLHWMCGWCNECDVPMFQCTKQHWQPKPQRKLVYTEVT
jgi:hypothetical protein